MAMQAQAENQSVSPDIVALLQQLMQSGGAGGAGGMGGAINNILGMLENDALIRQNNARVRTSNSGVDPRLYQTQLQTPILGGIGGGNMSLNIGSSTTTEGTVRSLYEQIVEDQLRQWAERITENSTDVISRGSPESRAALSTAIEQLLGGGTEQQRFMEAARRQEVARARQAAGDYTKSAAFADAEAAVQAVVRQAMEQSMGNLNRAVRGAGTSGGSMQALLAQNASRDAAELGAQTKLGAATAYGGINAQFQSILEALTRPDNSNVNSLLQALALAQQGDETRTSNKVTDRVGQETTTKTTTRNLLEQILKQTQQDTFELGIKSGGGSGGGGGSGYGTFSDESANDLVRDGVNLIPRHEMDARNREQAAIDAEIRRRQALANAGY